MKALTIYRSLNQLAANQISGLLKTAQAAPSRHCFRRTINGDHLAHTLESITPTHEIIRSRTALRHRQSKANAPQLRIIGNSA